MRSGLCEPLTAEISVHVREDFVFGEDGTKIYVRNEVGPPDAPGSVLLCDGIACDGFIWRFLWDQFRSQSHVWHWNYRGHGRSGLPADPSRLKVSDHVADLRRVRERVRGPLVLVGHSFGCQIALESYRDRPEDVVGLILINGSYGRITHTFRNSDILAQLLPRLIAQAEAYPALARALWSRVPQQLGVRLALMMGEVDKSLAPGDLVPYLDHMVNIDLPMYLKMLQDAGEHSAEDLLPSVRVPTLVLAGDRDQFTPVHCGRLIAERVPDAELHVASGGTHVVPLERKDWVWEHVQRFLEERVWPARVPSLAPRLGV